VTRAALAATLLLLPLAACQAAAERQVAATAATSSSAVAPLPAASPSPPAGGFAIRADRDRGDLIPGCPRHAPKQRPRDSNCYGIFPEQCGADRAAAHVGQPLTADRRREIEAIAPPGGIRFVRLAEAVTDDLRFQRLNVLLDAQGRVEKVDCH